MHLLSPRQIHLDFHTSELIPGIGKDFDAEAFARTAKEANVSSMTVFARCHHGMLYYDSKLFPERVHPHLEKRNLMVDQVRALHQEGINAPVYITVQWDYFTAIRKPEWLIRKADGSHEGDPFTEPGFYQSLCVNTGYYDFLKAQTEEVMDLLGPELDGLFFDIVGIRPCLCSACRAEMKAQGVDMHDEDAVRGFAKLVTDRFKQNMSAFIRERNPDCTIFYNAGHVGPCTRESANTYSHFELESLPSGGWGYLHFPVTAAYARKLGSDCMGMTGKFHTSWGDFHSLKNLAALEFEAFRMLSYGFACSIGDQLEPNGTLNPATYRLVGKVFEQFKAREEWARPSKAMTEVAILTNENILYEHVMPESILGAVQMLTELAVQFDVLDDTMALDGYKVVIVPDAFTVPASYQQKLDAYVQGGGKILACYHGGLNEHGQYPACYGASYHGDTALYPDFLIAQGELSGGLEQDNEYVVYFQGANVEPAEASILMEARAPYFKREGDQFCSHRYTPSAKGASYPAVLGSGSVVLFAHPMFTQYRDSAPHWIKQLVSNALDKLMPTRLVRHDGPSTLAVTMLDQPEKARKSVHLLSYVPVRKSATIDIIEDRTKVHDLTLEVGEAFTSARLVPEGTPLVVDGRRVKVPVVDGYAIVELT